MGKVKNLIEKKAEHKNAMTAIINRAEEEVRGFTDEESAEMSEHEAEISRLTDTIAVIERAENIEMPENTEERAQTETNGITAGRNALAAYIRGEQVRAGEMSISSSGVIPSEYSKDIIRRVTELSGIINKISVVNSKGVYKQIIADSSNKITAGWTPELAEVTASAAGFSTVDIGHHKLGALATVSIELINQNEFDIMGEVENQMIDDFMLKSELGIIKGTGSTDKQPLGLSTSGISYELAAAAITTDDLVKIYHKVKNVYQHNAVWLMSTGTLCLIRLLRDGMGQFLFHQSEMTDGFVGTILGKPVMLSDAMDELEAGKHPIFFGDYKRGYKANINPSMSVQLLNEQFATMGAKGILGFMFLDGRPVDADAYVNVSVAAT